MSSPVSPPHSRPARIGPAYALLLGIALCVLALDQISKSIVVSSLGGGRVVSLLGGHLFLDYTRNTGAAFSILQSGTWLFALIAAAVSAGIILFYGRVVASPWPVRVGLGLVLGGAVGNLVDRIRLGYVVDWIDLRWWPVFNVADSGVVVGALLLLLQSVLEQKDERDAG